MSGAARWTDAGWAAREHERLWPRCWLLAEHASRLARPGAFSVFDLGPRSAIIIRGQDGALRAFANACVHRGARLVDGVGCVARLRCPYHAWVYGLDGALAAAPHIAPLPTARLVELAVAERFGFAWVAFSSEVEPIDEFLAPLAGELARRDLGRYAIASDVSLALACNWKLSADVHAEALHVPTLHAEIAHLVDWKGSQVTRLGAHARIDVATRVEGMGDNVLLCVFPNVHLNLYPTRGFLLRHRPATNRADRTIVDHLTLTREAQAAPCTRRRATAEDPVIGPVLAADFRMAERVHRGLATGAIDEPLFTEAEVALVWMLEEIERRLT
jgi:phenylpropionate dioxygenase-like ring-hydroxylating dioxygenase large terminal subunit